MTDFDRRWLKDFQSMKEEMDFLFSNFFNLKRPPLWSRDRGWRPSTDVFETEDEFVIIMDIAGIQERNLHMTFEDGVLTIRGIREEFTGFGKRHYHKMEIEFGPFERRIKIDGQIEEDKIQAKYQAGFLEIRLKKLKPMPGESTDIPIE
ncbi:Hsp20/alpha crystallin family protein [candidate division KSB1 bacterium]|nr:Hsp20/alpha crystallin family protein [candidate division KSB1 bacterium]